MLTKSNENFVPLKSSVWMCVGLCEWLSAVAENVIQKESSLKDQLYTFRSVTKRNRNPIKWFFKKEWLYYIGRTRKTSGTMREKTSQPEFLEWKKNKMGSKTWGLKQRVRKGRWGESLKRISSTHRPSTAFGLPSFWCTALLHFRSYCPCSAAP